MDSLTSEFTYNSEANQLIYNGNFPANEVGYSYTTTLVLTAYLEINIVRDYADIIVEIVKPGPVGPVFVESLESFSLMSGLAWSYQLPEISDNSGASLETIVIDITENQANEFASFD